MQGQKRLRRALAAAVALAVLGIVGCDSEAARFNNTLAEYNRRLNAAGRQLGQAMSPALQGGQVDTDRIRAAHQAAWETVKEIKRDFATLEVPPSPSGKKFAEAYERFLRRQETMIRDDLGRVVRQLERPGGARSAAQMVRTMAMDLMRREAHDLKELQQIQREFCREHKLPLLPGR